MNEKLSLIEPSFADAIAMIAASKDLSEPVKLHWTTSLRQFAKAVDRPLEVIPARYSAVRNDLANWHHAPSGLAPKTVINHRSNTKIALLYLSQEKGIPEYGAPLTAAWEALRAKVSDSLTRSRLSSFIRYCSANTIAPKEVNETVVDRFMEYRNRCSKPGDNAFRRLLARAWNANVGVISDWPKRKLVELPVKSAVEIEWEEFPKGLRRDVDKYLNGLTKIRKSRTGRHIKPLRKSTIHGRRAELQAAARVAVKVGVPIDKLDSLRSILKPKVAKPDGPNSDYWLHFAPEDVKNTVRLQFVFKKYLTQLIDEYVQDFWPTLLRGRKEDYLFPGLRDGAKGKVSFSVQISKRIYKATGVKMTVHQFRHAAGAIILKNRPGEFELVRQILGHRSIATTMRCYVGLETIQASEIFTNMVVAEISQSLLGEDDDHAR